MHSFQKRNERVKAHSQPGSSDFPVFRLPGQLIGQFQKIVKSSKAEPAGVLEKLATKGINTKN